MNVVDSIQLMNKYNNCLRCGSDKIGNGAGKLIIEDDTFHRSCKCGWSITVDENDKPVE
jgi:hypothetical protein